MVNELNFNGCWYSNVCGLFSGEDNRCESMRSCNRYLEMETLMEYSHIPPSKQVPLKLVPDEVDYSAFVQLSKIKDEITAFVRGGTNLYIVSSTTGNGKTSWAIKLMLKYFDSVWAGNGFRCRGIFVHVPTFLNKCKDFNNHDAEFDIMKGLLTSVDLVIWDDIGSVGLSNYDLSQLTSYVDQRVLDDKANIFTGNLIGHQLDVALGERLFSRVFNTSKVIELKGKDKRGL